MTHAILEWLQTQQPRIKGRVLEVGSRNINGSPRSVITADKYVGIDAIAGPDVDIVCNAHQLFRHFACESFDAVLCCEMLEHDDAPWITIQQIRGVLKSGGLLLVTTPGNGFHEHGYPKDYFRFMPDFYRDVIFANMRDFVLHVTKDGTLCGSGVKP